MRSLRNPLGSVIVFLLAATAALDPQCDSTDDYKVMLDGTTYFSVSRGGSCTCNGSLIGNGSQLTGLGSNPEIAAYKAQISLLNTTVNAQAAAIASLSATIMQLHNAMIGQVRYAPASSCLAIKQAAPYTPDGNYWLGTPEAPFVGSCDMTTDGGGWTLVLNYLRSAGVGAPTTPHTATLPQKTGNGDLGSNEAGYVPNWGHAVPSMLARLPFTSTRFFCRTTAHSRVVHFKTSDDDCLRYLSNGLPNSGTCRNVTRSVSLLSGHSAILPAAVDAGFVGQGDYALTVFPFYQNHMYHWGVCADSIYTCRCECDDYAMNFPAGVAPNGYSTMHRVWVR